jgi:hypothetical protein
MPCGRVGGKRFFEALITLCKITRIITHKAKFAVSALRTSNFGAGQVVHIFFLICSY